MSIRRHHRAFLCGSAAAGALLAFAAPAPVAAQSATYSFDIPAQDVGSALIAYGRAARQQLVFDGATVRNRTSSSLVGEYPADAGLEKLLQGTGLRAEFAADGAVRIVDTQAPQGGSAAGAGATVEALIVTAQKREEDIQDVPIAISAFSQEDLTRSQVAGGPDLMTQVPNMTFTKTNFTSYSIQIRGIGTQAISATTDPAVAVAFNNTPFIANHFFEQEFYDLQRVEVLRGPQGTLYGRNATAGVVNVISAKPKFFYEAKLAADVANYNSHRLEGMINVPLGDAAAFRLAGAWTKRDGFVTNTLAGEQTDGRNLWSWRASLAIEPTDWFRADLIYERFEEDDDRLRSGKQLCKKDPGPTMIGSKTVIQSGGPLVAGANYFSQGCLPSSLYSPDSFQTPNGFSLTYYGPLSGVAGTYVDLDPYASTTQSRDLREIETHIEPEYEATADLVELQLRLDVSDDLTVASETGFARDYIFSFQDFNRFNTTPGVFKPGGNQGNRFDRIDENGVFCDPQIGCTNRLAAADVATASSQQFSQEFRLSSDYEGPFDFSLGANFLRYDTEIKYYVFINTLGLYTASGSGQAVSGLWTPGVTDNVECLGVKGLVWSDPNAVYDLTCAYIDPNDVHHLNDQGRNYFLSKNPYSLLSYAMFGEAYYSVFSNLKVTGGLRWTVDKKTAPQHPSWLLAGVTYGTPVRKVVEQEWREPTGRLAIDWKPELGFTDETLVYGSYVRGYKAGGANPPPPIVVLPPVGGEVALAEVYANASLTHPETFEAEFVDAYELGAKNTLIDGRLTLNLGGFYYDYTGYQISQIVNRSSVNLNFDADVWGLELEADWRPVENLRLGLKAGYENTRVADGSQAIDLMDRTAGQEGWVLTKPFPPQSSNCVIAEWFAEMIVNTPMGGVCGSFLAGVDPLTRLPYIANPTEYADGNQIRPITPSTFVGGIPLFGYQGYDPTQANNGEGFPKDLSGNELPNAPDLTTTLTVDYTIPLAGDWLMTLHTDLYRQSEAWTRIFNTEGYDKLKAYTNVNLAAIFTNEDAGWNVMAYVKNVFDRDSITGAFLNSDDTGLTTNVFLTEPRLYGIRVTKNWNGDAPWGGWFAGQPSGHSPFRVEMAGYYGPFSPDHDSFTPAAVDLYPADHPYPLWVQEDVDWGSAGGGAFTYQPNANGWFARAAVRYGRASGEADDRTKRSVPGGTLNLYFGSILISSGYIDPTDRGAYNYSETSAASEETHMVVDFMAGRDWGLGSGSKVSSTLGAGLRYADLGSVSEVTMHGRPDLYIAPVTNTNFFDPSTFPVAPQHRFHATAHASREFEGTGVAGQWDVSVDLFGDSDTSGEIRLEAGLGGGVLWGKQKANVSGEVNGTYTNFQTANADDLAPPYTLPVSYSRERSVTVPTANASLGLAYELGRVKVSSGYRWERFFDAIDGGIEERQEFDRDIKGAYFKVSVGFGS